VTHHKNMCSLRSAARCIAGVLITIHALLLMDSARRDFVTVDEYGHVPAGLSHWLTGTFHQYQVNPPLPRMLAALLVLCASPQTDFAKDVQAPGSRAEWPSGAVFLELNRDRYFNLIRIARLSTIAWSVLGAWLVFSWSRELFGSVGGLLSLSVWCFGPNVLGHGHLVTPDVPATVSGFAATYAFWRFLWNGSKRGAVVCGVLLGIALLTKFTCLLLIGIWPAMWFATRWSVSSKPAQPQAPEGWVACWVVIVLTSLFVVNLGYGFQRTCRPLASLAFVSRSLGGPPPAGIQVYELGVTGNRFRDSWLGSIRIPLPADYLEGIDVQKREFESALPSYLRGEIRLSGWWYYYLNALCFKVPIGVWLLIVIALIATGASLSTGAEVLDIASVWLPPILILAAVSAQTGFTSHLRYVLPICPFVAVGIGILGYIIQNGHVIASLMVVASLLWAIVSSLAIHPHYISYFNEAAGGPENGSYYLADSNIDWGQDLTYLQQWLREHPEARPLGLAYFNSIDAHVLGISYTLPPQGPNGLFPGDESFRRSLGPQPGYYAVSVNLTRGYTVLPIADGLGGFRRVPPDAYTYFLHFKPIAKAGYSIFIYHVTLEEANRVRSELGLPLLAEDSKLDFVGP